MYKEIVALQGEINRFIGVLNELYDALCSCEELVVKYKFTDLSGKAEFCNKLNRDIINNCILHANKFNNYLDEVKNSIIVDEITPYFL